MVCPSRRAPGQSAKTTGPDANWYAWNGDQGDVVEGPVGDYAMVGYSDETRVRTSGMQCDWWNMGYISTASYGEREQLSYFFGPFRPAVISGDANLVAWGTQYLRTRDGNAWQPRDTFAWIQDGLSNQLLIGEKFIPRDMIGVCNRTSGGEATGDCSYLTSGDVRWMPSMRFTRFNCNGGNAPWDDWKGGIASVGLEAERLNIRRPFFGSSHAGACNFVLGDGSVRGLSQTINVDTFADLGNVNSGTAVSIP
jgi:hypothetical protein